jgi:glycosyltransferase involved in cell wall biosynthesis
MANAIQDTYGRRAEIIYPPIRLADYRVTAGGGFYYLAVSRLVSHKRIDLVVAACEELGRPLVVVGDGPEMANLAKLGSANTEFRGKVSDDELRELYRNSRAVLFPSYEDYGLVPLEAQASGKPVLAFGAGGVLETVIDGVTGVFFPEQSVPALRDAILKFENSSFDPDTIRQSVEGFDVGGFKSHLQDFVARAWRESKSVKSKRNRSIARRERNQDGKPQQKTRGLRLLFLNHNVVRFGGTFYRALDIARFLVRCGHSVTLMSISPTARLRSSTEMVDGVEIIHTPDLFWGIGRSGWDLWDVFVRIRLAATRRWDLIHAWDSRPVVILPALVARFFSRREGAKLVIDWSDWWGRGGTQMERGGGWTRYLYNAIETIFEEQFRRFADGTTVISSPLRDRATALGVDREKILLLSQGCDAHSAQPDISRESARDALGVSPDELLFITIGVLNMSDAKLLFESMEIVLHRMPSIHFRLVGRNRAPVPAHLAALGVQEVGYVSSEILDLYMAAADALLVPLADNVSSRARWPSRVNMALSRGLPVVITRVGDLPALLEREDAAFIAQPNPAGFAERIIEAAAQPEDLRRVSAAGKRVAAERLPWSEIIARLENFYIRVLGDFHDEGDSIYPLEVPVVHAHGDAWQSER